MNDDEQLYPIFLNYEKEKTGVTATDLKGQPLLQTELSWLNRYCCETFENNFQTQSQCNLFLNDFTAELWQGFVTFIYERVGNNKAECGKIIKRVISFIKFLYLKNYLTESETEILLNSLKFEQKKVDRNLKIFKHLSHVIHSRVYTPDPTENFEHIDLNEAFYLAQIPEIINKYDDEFKVITFNKMNHTIYLRSLNSSDAIVLKVDHLLIKLVKKGDIYPLKLGVGKENNTILLDYSYPTFPS